MTRAGLREAYRDIPRELPGAVGRSLGGLFLATLRAPEVAEALGNAGLEEVERYFPPRAAPLGAAPLPLAVSTFFNFSPAAVRRAIPHVWEKVSPEKVLAAQADGLDRALRRAFAPLDPSMVPEAAGLVRRAAEAASGHPEGRPLFSAWASLPWPTEPHLQLWHGFYLLREFRGDGHIAVLTAEGLSGVEALALHVAQVPALGPVFRPSRAWSDEEWGAALAALRAEGWLSDAEAPTFTAEGAERRRAIESWTDELDVAGYGSLGVAGCERIIELAAPISAALLEAGLGFSIPGVKR